MYSPFERLKRFSRINFKSNSLDVACIALHLAGSGNYSPAGVYTSIFKRPNLPWVLGHEGTHLLLSSFYGKDWTRHKQASYIISLLQKNGLQKEDCEEMLCIFMQLKLSQDCGLSESSRKMSSAFENNKWKQKVLIQMENRWDTYLKGQTPDSDIIDFMVQCTIKALLP